MTRVVVGRSDALPDEIDALVRESLAEGHRFVARLRDDWRSGANRFDRPGEAFFEARVAGALAGVCGLNRDPFTDDPGCGRLRRLYVRPGLRRRGVAGALTRAALAAARGRFARVRLLTDHSEAAAFYEALGFASIAGDPDATHVWEL